jgi:hypothetical protein
MSVKSLMISGYFDCWVKVSENYSFLTQVVYQKGENCEMGSRGQRRGINSQKSTSTRVLTFVQKGTGKVIHVCPNDADINDRGLTFEQSWYFCSMARRCKVHEDG